MWAKKVCAIVNSNDFRGARVGKLTQGSSGLCVFFSSLRCVESKQFNDSRKTCRFCSSRQWNVVTAGR